MNKPQYRDMENARSDNAHLQELCITAPCSRDAVYTGDFAALGQAILVNHEAQRRLHPALISPDADCIIEIAREHGSIGWKVMNGAGGDGGSLTLLCGSRSDAKRVMIREIEPEDTRSKNIPIYLSRFGLRVWMHTLNSKSQ